MKEYQVEELKIEGNVNIRRLRQFCMKEELNEHMKFSLEGEVSAEDAKEYERMKLLGQSIRVLDTYEGRETVVGCGIVTGAELEITGGVHLLHLKGYSASYRMDREKKKRSFQNASERCQELVKRIGSAGVEISYRYDKAGRLDTPLIQYEETDWELLKRVSGHLNTVLFPDVQSDRGRVCLGSYGGAIHNLEAVTDYQISAQSGSKKSRLCRIIRKRMNMKLGDTVVMDRQRWIVVGKQAEFQEKMLEMTYTLGRLNDWRLADTVNPQLRGASITGKVLSRKDEYVKLWLEIDSSQKKTDAFWYPYLPETGNIMYAMPEEGAKVILYFPDGREQNAIAVRSVLSKSRQSDKTKPWVKELKTPDGKKLRLNPNELELIGGRGRGVNALFLGDGGIRLESRRGLRIQADKEIDLSAGLNSRVTAVSHISVKQTGGNNQIDLFGNQILFRAEKYITASRTHKSMKGRTVQPSAPTYQNAAALYNIWLGMIAQGDAGERNQSMLGGIPTLGSVNGEISASSQIGLHVARSGW